jgi:GGDEF domain-containing protein
VRTLHRIDQHDLHLTASIGIVTYPDDGTDAETLMKNADFAAGVAVKRFQVWAQI